MVNKLLDGAIELQSIAQVGLYYCKDKFDIERFERIREISAEKNNEEQIKMCFEAYHSTNWKTLFD